MKIKNYFPPYIHYSIFLISAFVFAMALDISMLDDGLRHIAFAENKGIMHSWAEVYPHSLFTEYDPWLSWHYLIKFLLQFISYDTVHIVINTVSLFVFMTLVYSHFVKESTYNFASFTYIIVFVITLFTSYRYTIVRPDLLSGLFVMSALLLKNRWLPIFIMTVCYGPFYYLFFIYTGSLGLVYMVQKKWRSFMGIFMASLMVGSYYLIQNAPEYINLVMNILTDQTLRMGLRVGEGKPLFAILSNLNYFALLIIFFGGAAAVIYWKYDYFKTNAIATFLLITSLLWMNQYRYFQMFSALIVVYVLSVGINTHKKKLMQHIRKYFIIVKRNFSYASKTRLFYMVAIPYSIFMLSFVFKTYSQNKVIEETKFFKEDKYQNKTVLMNIMHTDKYKALYHNPTLHFVPSCSIGWFDDKDKGMKDIYIRMQKDKGITESELARLAAYVDADIYIHYMKNKEQVLNFEKLKNLGILPEEIYHNRVVFKIQKNKSIPHE